MKNDNISTNIFTHIPEQLPAELFETLLQRDNIHIERIVSKGHITHEGQWYDQAWDEWVILLQGQAIVRYLQDDVNITLQAGDYMLIPAHTKHRVEWTQSECNSIWLAIHLH
jgi:cupin 2 domain-containing protein